MLISFIQGCGNKKDVIAELGNKSITVSDLNDRISKLPDRFQDIVMADKAKFLDDVISDELLYAESLRKGYDKDKEVMGVVEEAKKKIFIAKLLKDNVEDAVKVTNEEIRAYYDSHSGEFTTPEIYRAAHIMVKTEDDAKEALRLIASGVRFEDVVIEKSIDPSKNAGGDIGYFVKGQVDPDFEKACFQMKVGQLSGAVKTKFGYHVIKLLEVKPSSVEKYDDVKERIMHNLVIEKRKNAFSKLMDDIKKKTKIKINKDKLKNVSRVKLEKGKNEK